METLREKIVVRVAEAFNHPHAREENEDNLNELFNETATNIIQDIREILGIN